MEWQASLVKARVVLLVRGLAGEASSGADRCGQVSHGMAGVVSREKVRSGVLMNGFAGELWLGWSRRVRFSQAWFGEAGLVRTGVAWPVPAWKVTARYGRLGTVR